MSENNGKVSIIVPVYNNEKYIKKCINSILCQSYGNIQVIVIDDGSTDLSSEILKQVSLKDSRITLIRQNNSGVSAARNKGIKYAIGEYLTFIDGDDYIGVNYIKDLVSYALSNQADMVICGMKKVDESGTIIEEIIPGIYNRFEREEWTFRLSAVATHLYRRELWEKYAVSFYEGERGEDIPIALFFSSICEKIVTFSKADYYYVQHANSAIHNFTGLKKYNLPYIGLENAIIQIREVGIKNSKEFHELFVLRILATFTQLARGADKKEIQKLAKYINYILDKYYPQYYKNKLVKIFSCLDIPFFQKIVVYILVKVKRLGLVSVFLKMVC